MAFSKKNKRRITVNGKNYFWYAWGDDCGINLLVRLDVREGQKLLCLFDYYPHNSISNHFVITPYIVRQVIEYGLQQGWQPLETKPDLHLGHIDDKIDLRLPQNSVFKIKGIDSEECLSS